jgi:hypothetical protein
VCCLDVQVRLHQVPQGPQAPLERVVVLLLVSLGPQGSTARLGHLDR